MLLEEIPEPGTNVILELKNIFGESFYERAKIIGSPKMYGYITPGGGWSLYGGKDDKESYLLSIKKYKRRNIFNIRIENIFGIEIVN